MKDFEERTHATNLETVDPYTARGACRLKYKAQSIVKQVETEKTEA